MPKDPTIADVRKAVVILDAAGKPVTAEPGEGKFTFRRAPGPAVIPAQVLVRELLLAYPKASFTFVTANVKLQKPAAPKA